MAFCFGDYICPGNVTSLFLLTSLCSLLEELILSIGVTSIKKEQTFFQHCGVKGAFHGLRSTCRSCFQDLEIGTTVSATAVFSVLKV